MRASRPPQLRRRAELRLLVSLAFVAVVAPLGASRPASGASALPEPAPLDRVRGPGDGEAIGIVAAVLRHRGASDERSEEQLVAELIELGPEHVPALFSICTGEALPTLLGLFDGAAWQTGPDRLPELARSALHGMRTNEVIKHLQARTGPNAPLEHRLEALRVVAGLRSPSCLPLVLRIMKEAGPLALRYRSVKKPLVEALAATLVAGGGTWRELKKEVGNQAPAVLRVVLEAVQEAGRPEGLDVLAELLGYVPELDPDVVTTIAELHDKFPWLVPRDGRELVRPLLDSRDAEVRRAAACALATMGDQESFAQVAELLRDDDARVRWAAQQSLQLLSGTRLPADVDVWLAWYDVQQSWWYSRSERLAAQLVEQDVGRAMTALRELTGRPLFRHEAAELVAGSLWSQHPELAAASCLALETLASRRAVPGLSARLSDRKEERVHAAALHALEHLTGEALPPDAHAWEEYTNGEVPVPKPRPRQS